MFLKRRKQKAPSSSPPATSPKEVSAEKCAIPSSPQGASYMQFNPRLISHHGVPRLASSLSFDPVQRLLAICTIDGRIKIYGRDGVEGLLLPYQQMACKFVEFMYNKGYIVVVTVRNDIQIWDMNQQKLVCSHRWDAEIMAFSVVHGNPYMYIGEDSGNVIILQYAEEGQLLHQMPYNIPPHIVSSLLRSPSSIPPSVIGILLLPEKDVTRVLIIYGNGAIVLWGLEEARVLAIRGTAVVGIPEEFDALNSSNQEGDDDEKDICCVCWASTSGNVMCVGYTDGDIWFWDIPTVSRGSLEERTLQSSNDPLFKLQVSAKKQRAPVVVMRWSAGGGRVNSGLLFVFGGGELGRPEAITLFHLRWDGSRLENCIANQMELSLPGPFDDMILLASAGSTVHDPAAALLVLTNPGQLAAYDASMLLDYFHESGKDVPQPMSIEGEVTQSAISVMKLFTLPRSLNTLKVLSQLPWSYKGLAPSVLVGGTRWPVTGGSVKLAMKEDLKCSTVLLTGHEDGSVNVWDVSSPVLIHLSSLQNGAKSLGLSSQTTSISCFEFCPLSGLLAVGDDDGVVMVYTLNSEAGNIKFVLVTDSAREEQELSQEPGFQRIAVLDIHHAPISCITISSSPSLVAIGCTNGLVSVFEVDTRSILFHHSGFCMSPKRIVSMLFGPAAQFPDSIITSSASSSSVSEKFPLPDGQFGALYVLAQDGALFALDGTSGSLLSSSSSKDSSVALSLHLMGQETCLDSSYCYEAKLQQESGSAPISGNAESNPCYLLICKMDALSIYGLLNPKQESWSSIYQVSLKQSCCWASTFVGERAALILMDYKLGSLQIRMIPDMEVIKELSMDECLKWKLHPGAHFARTLTCTSNGQIALIDGEKELVLLSIIDDNASKSTSIPIFFDKDVAAAMDAALRASVQSTKRKSEAQGILSVVMKELKEGMLKATSIKEDPTTITSLKEFHRILTSPSHSSMSKAITEEDNSIHSVDEIDIDDLDIDDDDDDEELSSPVLVSPSSGSFISKVKGKDIASPSKDIRSELLGEEKRKPGKRTPEEIRAFYGRRLSGEGGASGAAGLARDKLLERQEKLEALSRRTQEMQEGAENFASMASELAKTMERRKWWQL